jgi:hypothetical protein
MGSRGSLSFAGDVAEVDATLTISISVNIGRHGSLVEYAISSRMGPETFFVSTSATKLRVSRGWTMISELAKAHSQLVPFSNRINRCLPVFRTANVALSVAPALTVPKSTRVRSNVTSGCTSPPEFATT